MKLICLSLCVFLIPALCNGSDALHREGNKSISFSFDGFKVANYKYGIGGKYWKNDNIAFTGSIDFVTGTYKSSAVASGSSLTTDQNYHSNQFTIGVERHLGTSSKVSPYVGGEVLYTTSDSTQTSNNESSGESYGVNVIFGVEYSFDQEVSLGAEYYIGYLKSDNSFTTPNTTQSIKSESFQTGAGALVLSVYY